MLMRVAFHIQGLLDMDSGFYGNIGVMDILKAKLVAMLKGLEMVWAMNCKDVICIFSSLNVFSIVKEGVPNCH